MTVLAVWFTLGLFLDAYAHANFPDLETFFTLWHAVFYSGFAATAGWVLWTVCGQVREGRRGIAAVPPGYGLPVVALPVVALPVFALSDAIDLMWHELLGIETSTDIFFSPSHLGLITSMVVILTSPLRAARGAPDLAARPSLRAVLPGVLTLGFSVGLVLLFLTYGNALLFDGREVVTLFSTGADGGADMLAVRIVLTTVVLLAPLLLLARRWGLPAGAATTVFIVAALISFLLTGFGNPAIIASAVVAGVAVDGLARVLRPTGERRTAFWAFAAATPFVTWVVYPAAASIEVGHLPAVIEFWTGMPIVAALIGWLLGALMLPNAPARVATD